jgi:SAM-dependent methyltransferase
MPLDLLPPSLAKDENGIWHCKARSAPSYPEDGNSFCLQIEDDSFWYRHRNRCIVSAVRRFAPTGLIVDAGGGNGYVARGLQDAGFEVMVVEPGAAGALASRRRGIEHVICGAFQDVGFPPASVPAIGLFDVLEHIEGDGRALADMHRALAPGGRIYVTVPAYQFLFSEEDRWAGHFRRYTVGSLSRLLAGAGFEIEYSSYFFLPLPLPIFVFRTIFGRLGIYRPADSENAALEHTRAGLAHSALNRVLDLEAQRIARGRRIGLGSSCLAVARKMI